MKMRMFLRTLLVFCTVVVLSGCVGTVDGRKKAGNPFINDKISSLYETPVTAALTFQAAKTVLLSMGNLYGENTINNTLEAKVDTRTVFVKVEDVEGNIKVTTQVRTKGGGADVPLASEVDKRIGIELTTQVNKVQ